MDNERKHNVQKQVSENVPTPTNAVVKLGKKNGVRKNGKGNAKKRQTANKHLIPNNEGPGNHETQAWLI